MFAEVIRLVDALSNRTGVVEVGEQRQPIVLIVDGRRERVLGIAQRAVIVRRCLVAERPSRELKQVLIRSAEAERAALAQERGFYVPVPRRDNAAIAQLIGVEEAGLDERQL